MSTPRTTRSAKVSATSKKHAPAGRNDSLNGQARFAAHMSCAIEGNMSRQATLGTIAPAGNETTRDQAAAGTHGPSVPGASIPAAHGPIGTHGMLGSGDHAPPTAINASAPIYAAPLADPLLAFAADVLDDLEKVRIANENRLRQLTRDTEDNDGEVRGFGLDESHPDVARLAALVDMLKQAEHQAELNLGRLMRKHPFGPWVKAQKGIGEKQGARLLAAIGDPYMRPEIVREDGTVEPSRPRLISELWAFAGYHVIDGAAAKRARGVKANWSSAAKMRAYLVAESCIKQMDGQYRAAYDATRAKYANAVHATECVRCGPSAKPAQPGSPLSDGHKHARALRAVAKEVLRDLWREAKRLYEQAPVSGHSGLAAQCTHAADGLDIPAGHGGGDTQVPRASRDQDAGHEAA